MSRWRPSQLPWHWRGLKWRNTRRTSRSPSEPHNFLSISACMLHCCFAMSEACFLAHLSSADWPCRYVPPEAYEETGRETRKRLQEVRGVISHGACSCVVGRSWGRLDDGALVRLAALMLGVFMRVVRRFWSKDTLAIRVLELITLCRSENVRRPRRRPRTRSARRSRESGEARWAATRAMCWAARTSASPPSPIASLIGTLHAQGRRGAAPASTAAASSTSSLARLTVLSPATARCAIAAACSVLGAGRLFMAC